MDPQWEHVGSPSLTNHILESLFFSMSVYEATQEAVVKDLECRFGIVQPLMHHGFDGEGQQAIFAARSSSGRIIVACRGTAGFWDVLQDLKYMQCRLSFSKGGAHWGFAERAESVPIDFFCKLLKAGEEIIFTGHSLGGAVASLLSLRVLKSSKGKFDKQLRCITFGSPLFASSRLAEIINDNYKDIFIHIVSRRDCVPKLLPLVSTLQKVVYGDECHLEGLMVLKNILGFLPWFPVAPLITALERRIPALLKFVFRCVMKLAMPSGIAGSYEFAGHIVILNTELAVNVDSSMMLACAEDLNLWHSQLNFAFGCGFDVKMIEEHMLQCYHDGIVRAFSQVRVTRQLALSATQPRAPSAIDELTESSFKPQSVTMLDRIRQTASVAQVTLPSSNRELRQQQNIVVRMIPQEGDCEMQHQFDATEFHLKEEDVEEESKRRKKKNKNRMDMEVEGLLKRSQSNVHHKDSGVARLTRTKSAGEGCSRVPSMSCKLERSMTMMSRTTSGSSVWTTKLDRHQDMVVSTTHRCRACSCLQVYMNVKTPCRESKRKGIRIGWLLGTVGRVALHLKVLDNLCFFTFVRLVASNLLK